VDVIRDRYYYSSLAYQGSQTDPAWVRAMNLDCPEIARPDLCIFLDLTPVESLARIQRGRETQEIYENYETLKKVRDRFFEVFEELKETDHIVVVNAARPIEVIADEIARIVADA
jgi:dTMP kinase